MIFVMKYIIFYGFTSPSLDDKLEKGIGLGPVYLYIRWTLAVLFAN